MMRRCKQSQEGKAAAACASPRAAVAHSRGACLQQTTAIAIGKVAVPVVPPRSSLGLLRLTLVSIVGWSLKAKRESLKSCLPTHRTWQPLKNLPLPLVRMQSVGSVVRCQRMVAACTSAIQVKPKMTVQAHRDGLFKHTHRSIPFVPVLALHFCRKLLVFFGVVWLPITHESFRFFLLCGVCFVACVVRPLLSNSAAC